MGNSESQLGRLEARQSTKSRANDQPPEPKRHSLSPSLQIPARSSSLKLGGESSERDMLLVIQKNEVNRRIQQRRAKSFRNNRGRNDSFRLPTCPVTGLTSNQKRLIRSKWQELDKSGILDMGRNVFETLFRKDPAFLQAIGLDHMTDRRNLEWRHHINFRVHAKRFCEVLNDVIRSFDCPRTTVDELQELGALHCNTYKKDAHKLPTGYWDALVHAIHHAAKDLQVDTSSRGSESPSAVLDKRFLLPEPDLPGSTPPSPSPLSNLGVSTPIRRYGSVCPRAAEAWNTLAIYAVSQMRFGYEMERSLRTELRRLARIVGVKFEEPRGSAESDEPSSSSESPQPDSSSGHK